MMELALGLALGLAVSSSVLELFRRAQSWQNHRDHAMADLVRERLQDLPFQPNDAYVVARDSNGKLSVHLKRADPRPKSRSQKAQKKRRVS